MRLNFIVASIPVPPFSWYSARLKRWINPLWIEVYIVSIPVRGQIIPILPVGIWATFKNEHNR